MPRIPSYRLHQGAIHGQLAPEIKGAFLRPKGWHLKKSTQGETLGYFITKQDIDKTGSFTTGLTVNVIRNVPKKKGMTPLEFAHQFRGAARESNTIQKQWDRDMGPFQAVGFLYERQDDAGAFTVHNLAIANNGTGTLYLVMFEGPSAEWEKTWKVGAPMLEYLLIDDEI